MYIIYIFLFNYFLHAIFITFLSFSLYIIIKYKYMWIGKNILKGETDGSSYPNGGLRATHAAGGYLSVDPTS